MGNRVIKIVSDIFYRTKKEQRVLMVGLDAAGKTTILYRLKLDESVTTIPTIGFNVETLEAGKFKFTVWDVGGQDKIRPLWRHYFQNTDALIFVVDSADAARMDEARSELTQMIKEDELSNAIILVFANKQDIQGALRPCEVTERLGLNELDGREWYVQGATAYTGQGLVEGIKWLANRLEERESR